MGYLDRSASASYDAALEKAVQRFQQAHGLEPDGVAGKGTISEINIPMEKRLKSVLAQVKKEPGAILFIDEIHTIIGAGSASGGTMDASIALVDALRKAPNQTLELLPSGRAKLEPLTTLDGPSHLALEA